jgi:hypothetical protein
MQALWRQTHYKQQPKRVVLLEVRFFLRHWMVAHERSWSRMGREDHVKPSEDGLDASRACKVPPAVLERNRRLGWQCDLRNKVIEKTSSPNTYFFHRLFDSLGIKSTVRFSRGYGYVTVAAPAAARVQILVPMFSRIGENAREACRRKDIPMAMANVAGGCRSSPDCEGLVST